MTKRYTSTVTYETPYTVIPSPDWLNSLLQSRPDITFETSTSEDGLTYTFVMNIPDDYEETYLDLYAEERTSFHNKIKEAGGVINQIVESV